MLVEVLPQSGGYSVDRQMLASINKRNVATTFLLNFVRG